MQSVYYGLKLDHVCRKIRSRHKFEYDINAILSDLVYTRILEPSSKRSSFQAASQYLEPPSYALHDIYHAMSVLAQECDFIQSKVYKNSFFFGKRSDRVLYYDCTNYYFGIEQEDGDKKYGKSKEHRPNPIIQMGLFTDGDGIPLAFSLFPGNSNEQTSLKPLEKKILQEFGHDKFIYCSDAGLGSEANREFNHMGQRAFIVTQSIKKRPAEERKRALERTGFKRVSDESIADITSLDQKDKGSLFYKDAPYTTKKLHQRLVITCSPKYAAYQKTIRGKQIEREEKMVSDGKMKKQRKNPNDPAGFAGKFLALLIYRMLEKNPGRKYTCEKLLGTLKGMNFADVEGQGYMPLYQRETITDDLHAASGFRTDFQFITKRQMKTIQKRSKGRE